VIKGKGKDNGELNDFSLTAKQGKKVAVDQKGRTK
jgi:hypothetical protein